jgi:3'-phosphoadenosine 5'-phosphosulfate sulfotransferase (PAPS reductase)/FAD synthetase
MFTTPSSTEIGSMSSLFDFEQTPVAAVREPLVVAYGMGVDSTAMLVGLHQRGERPDLILWADTGDEKPETYAYLPVINAWLRKVGFPEVTVVRNARPKSGDKSLSESLLRLGYMAALAYGQHQCSIVWKLEPQQKFVKTWAPAVEAWAAGLEVVTCIGYDAGPRDSCRQYKAEGKAADGYRNRFPLIELGWDREECKRQIAAAGLPVPVKSACFHCPAMKRDEIQALRTEHPVLFHRALQIQAKAIALQPEREAARKAKAEAEGRKFRPATTVGLGRSFAWADNEEGVAA